MFRVETIGKCTSMEFERAGDAQVADRPWVEALQVRAQLGWVLTLLIVEPNAAWLGRRPLRQCEDRFDELQQGSVVEFIDVGFVHADAVGQAHRDQVCRSDVGAVLESDHLNLGSRRDAVAIG